MAIRASARRPGVVVLAILGGVTRMNPLVLVIVGGTALARLDVLWYAVYVRWEVREDSSDRFALIELGD